MDVELAASGMERLWKEVREVSLGTGSEVERLPSAPTPLRFMRDYVSQNKPCVISSSSYCSNIEWPPLPSAEADKKVVSVHLTPDGRADSLVTHPHDPSSQCFASPHVQSMPFPQALQLISNPTTDFVAYAQEQNDCFRTQYSWLRRFGDVDDDVPWATEALGCPPEAVNLWIGNGASETSFHKDHYENLYAVVAGRKHFLLLPPTDFHRLYIRPYPAARYSYSQDTAKFTLELEKPLRYVPWCSVNPYPPPHTRDSEIFKFPLYFNGPKPFECTLNPGEILYLPSMWFHHVRQTPDSSDLTVAINYWYDMQFDIKYAYFNFLRSVKYDPTAEGIDEGEDEA